MERSRDKVIQDDFEFKDFLSQQDKIVDKFLNALNLKMQGSKNDFYKWSSVGHAQVRTQGLDLSSRSPVAYRQSISLESRFTDSQHLEQCQSKTDPKYRVSVP